MKLAHCWSARAAVLAAFFYVCAPALAQWQVPNYAVPEGRGAGTGFKAIIPGTAGYPLTSNGASSSPTFQGFVQEGTGAITRTPQDKARDIFSVKDFCTASQISTDATTCINASFTAACARGASESLHRTLVHFPADFYKISGTLTVPCSLMGIEGDGSSQSIIQTSSTSATILTIEGADSSNFITGIPVTGIRLQRANTVPAEGSYGIKLKYATDVKFTDVKSYDSDYLFFQEYSNTISYVKAVASRRSAWTGAAGDIFRGFTVKAGGLGPPGLGAFSTVFIDSWALGQDGVESGLFGGDSRGWDVYGADQRDISWRGTQVAGTQYGYFLNGTETLGDNNWHLSFENAIADNVGLAGLATTNYYNRSNISWVGGFVNLAAATTPGTPNYAFSFVGTQNVSVDGAQCAGNANLPYSRCYYLASNAVAGTANIAINGGVIRSPNIGVVIDYQASTPVWNASIIGVKFTAFQDGSGVSPVIGISLNSDRGTVIAGNSFYSDADKWANGILATNTPDKITIRANSIPTDYVTTPISGTLGSTADVQILEQNSYFKGSNFGFGTASPASLLSVAGGVSVGSYAGTTAAPSNGAIISGNVGIGNSSPGKTLDVTGTVRASDQITSTLATGTAPFSIASTTLVPNLYVARSALADAVAVGGITGLGTGVATALGVNVGSAGAFVANGGALGTPASGTVTNLTGTASININGTVGATTPSTVASTTITNSGKVIVGSSGSLTSQLQVVTTTDGSTGNPSSWDSQYLTVGAGGSAGGNLYMSYNQAGEIGYIGAIHPGVTWGTLTLQHGGGAVAIGSGGAGVTMSINGSAALSTTKTVRDAAGTGTCTLIYTAGLLTGGSC